MSDSLQDVGIGDVGRGAAVVALGEAGVEGGVALVEGAGLEQELGVGRARLDGSGEDGRGEGEGGEGSEAHGDGSVVREGSGGEEGREER